MMANTPPLTPMDIYSTHWVPFTVAAFCRGRKYMPEAVALSKVLRARLDQQEALRQAEAKLDEAEKEVMKAVAKVTARMEREGQA